MRSRSGSPSDLRTHANTITQSDSADSAGITQVWYGQATGSRNKEAEEESEAGWQIAKIGKDRQEVGRKSPPRPMLPAALSSDDPMSKMYSVRSTLRVVRAPPVNSKAQAGVAW